MLFHSEHLCLAFLCYTNTNFHLFATYLNQILHLVTHDLGRVSKCLNLNTVVVSLSWNCLSVSWSAHCVQIYRLWIPCLVAIVTVCAVFVYCAWLHFRPLWSFESKIWTCMWRNGANIKRYWWYVSVSSQVSNSSLY